MNALDRALGALTLDAIGTPELVCVVIIDGHGNRIVSTSASADSYPNLANQMILAADVVRAKVSPRKPDPHYRIKGIEAEKLARAAIEAASRKAST